MGMRAGSDTEQLDTELQQSLKELIQLRQVVFDQIDMKAREFILDENNRSVLAYRRALSQLLERNGDPIPFFASGPIVQVLQDELAGDHAFTLVFDSAILGNYMNLTVMNYFSTDRSKQEAEIEENFLLGNGGSVIANVLPLGGQRTKFSPWVGPGVDIELLGPSARGKQSRAPMAELSIHLEGSAKVVWNRRYDSEPVELNLNFPNYVRHAFKLPIPDFSSHCPRIRMGKAILQRENWKLDAKMFLPEPKKDHDPLVDYLEIIRKKEALGLPDCVYVDPDGPKKNILIDFKNFFLVEVLQSLARGNEAFRVSEMLPNTEQFALQHPKDGDQRFTFGMMPFMFFQSPKRV
jgi:hypothetical protein